MTEPRVGLAAAARRRRAGKVRGDISGGLGARGASFWVKRGNMYIIYKAATRPSHTIATDTCTYRFMCDRCWKSVYGQSSESLNIQALDTATAVGGRAPASLPY